MEAQSFSVKRAEVEFHNFASLGEPERVIATYEEENLRRQRLILNHLDFIGPMSPFLEIGANAGHSSYLLANEFGQQGFALDISADALRYGKVLMDRWKIDRAPIRVTGDAANLPFADNSMRMVLAFQMLSQFMDIEAVFLEVKRVLQPGGIFLFSDEPVRRLLSLRLYRVPYWEQMKPWERKLHQWGLLGYLAKDVIGAAQEENFGIRQNHRMTLLDWDRLVKKHFAAQEYELFIPRRGWGETAMYRIAKMIDRHGSDWVPARLLGGTIAAVCRKPGGAPPPFEQNLSDVFETLLRCPDCASALTRDDAETLRCAACGYESPDEEGVYNLLPAAEKKELYPGRRPDLIDFSTGPCADQILDGFYEVEGVYGNKYRWMTVRGVFRLDRVKPGPVKLRIRGHVPETMLQQGKPARLALTANGQPLGSHTLDRPGLFVLELPLPAEAPSYTIEALASPSFQIPPDIRTFTLNVSMMRLVED